MYGLLGPKSPVVSTALQGLRLQQYVQGPVGLGVGVVASMCDFHVYSALRVPQVEVRLTVHRWFKHFDLQFPN